MPIPTFLLPVLPAIAEALLSRWKDKKQGLPNSDLLIQALGQMIEWGRVSVQPGEGASADVIKRIEAAIKTFQSLLESSVSGVVADGRLTKEEAELLSPTDRPDTTASPPFKADDKTAVVAYRINSNVPQLVGGVKSKNLIATAFHLWLDEVNTLFLDNVTASPPNTFSNVEIKMGSLGAAGTILGEATVGGPGRMRGPLVITMNHHVQWNSFKFMMALCHEIGHVLGVEHVDAPGHLMSAVIDFGAVAGPSGTDLANFKKIWT